MRNSIRTTPVLAPFARFTPFARWLSAGAFALSLAACGGSEPRVAATPPDAGAITRPDATTPASPDATTPDPIVDGGVVADAGELPVDAGEPEAPALAIHAARADLMLGRGGGVDLEVVITRGEGFEESLALGIEGLPSGVTATVPGDVTGASVIIRLVAEPTAAIGAHALTLRAFSASASAEAHASLFIPGDAGQLDTSFGTEGVVELENTERVYFAHELPDGKTLVGYRSPEHTTGLTVARLLPSGDVDGDYGTGGKTSIPLTPEATIHFGFGGYAVDADGSVIVAARGRIGNDVLGWLLSLDADGERNQTFTPGGFVTVEGVMPQAITRVGDQLFVASRVPDGAYMEGQLAIWNAAEAGFGPTSTQVLSHFEVAAIAQDANGVYVSGRGSIGGKVCRFTTSGAPDVNFAGGCFELASGANDYYDAIATLSDGSLVVAGQTLSSNDWFPLVVRITSGGTLIPEFGTNAGWMIYTAFEAAIRTVSVDAEDRIFVGGDVALNQMVLAQITTYGAYDPNLGTRGPTALTDYDAVWHVKALSGRRLLVTSRNWGEGRVFRMWY
ncbi:hypothetical protein L6R52_26960 [Myxococcota bacterium]|nr:hypothetical protein [Myxococcota bacterium]